MHREIRRVAVRRAIAIITREGEAQHPVAAIGCSNYKIARTSTALAWHACKAGEIALRQVCRPTRLPRGAFPGVGVAPLIGTCIGRTTRTAGTSCKSKDNESAGKQECAFHHAPFG